MSNDSNKPAVDRFHENISDFSEIIADILKECDDKGCTIVNPILAQIGATVVNNYDKYKVVERFNRILNLKREKRVLFIVKIIDPYLQLRNMLLIGKLN